MSPRSIDDGVAAHRDSSGTSAPDAMGPGVRTTRVARRSLLGGMLGLATGTLARTGHSFGEDGAFNPRLLLVGDAKPENPRTTALARWADEVVRRTSAPARLRPTSVHADDPALLAEPFVVWSGGSDVPPLTSRERTGLKRFFALGGVLFVDDSEPLSGAFGRAARRELARVLPESAPVSVGPENVVFRSFYLLKRAFGRVEGPSTLDAILRAGLVQVVLSSHDVLGALARGPGGAELFEVEPGGDRQRELAIRLAVNIALYVTCSNYKDDQVHAEHIMRRRGAK